MYTVEFANGGGLGLGDEKNTDWTTIQYAAAQLWVAAARRGDRGNAGSD